MHRLPVPLLLAALAGSALLGGCGASTADNRAADDATTAVASPSVSTSPTATGTPSAAATTSAAPVLPDCATAWVDGKTLDFGYHGCVDGARTVKAQKQPCEIGKPLVTYANRFWAAAGGPVHGVSTILAKDAGWHRALIQCGG